MAILILLSVLIFFVASKEGLSHTRELCPIVRNNNPICEGNTTHMCVCDFTCSGWDKPCNWVVSCKAEIKVINDVRRGKNKLSKFLYPHI